MKTILILIAATVFTFNVHAKNTVSESTVQAIPQQGQIGVGMMVGTIVAATGKFWLTDKAALDFGIGFDQGAWTVIYADYLWHIPKVFGTNSLFGRESALYFGGGGGLGFGHGNGSCSNFGWWGCGWANNGSTASGTGAFIRGVVGVEWYPGHTRFGVFGEAGPSIIVSPGTWTTIDVAVGGRYFF